MVSQAAENTFAITLSVHTQSSPRWSPWCECKARGSDLLQGPRRAQACAVGVELHEGVFVWAGTLSLLCSLLKGSHEAGDGCWYLTILSQQPGSLAIVLQLVHRTCAYC